MRSNFHRNFTTGAGARGAAAGRGRPAAREKVAAMIGPACLPVIMTPGRRGQFRNGIGGYRQYPAADNPEPPRKKLTDWMKWQIPSR